MDSRAFQAWYWCWHELLRSVAPASSANTLLTLDQVSIPESSSTMTPSLDVGHGLPPSAVIPTLMEMAMVPTPLVPSPECKLNTAPPSTGVSDDVPSNYGPATDAAIFSIKVLSDEGSGAFSDIISGINRAVNHAVASRKPSVVNLSLGGSASPSIDSAVTSGISQGVHFTVGQLASRYQ